MDTDITDAELEADGVEQEDEGITHDEEFLDGLKIYTGEDFEQGVEEEHEDDYSPADDEV